MEEEGAEMVRQILENPKTDGKEARVKRRREHFCTCLPTFTWTIFWT